MGGEGKRKTTRGLWLLARVFLKKCSGELTSAKRIVSAGRVFSRKRNGEGLPGYSLRISKKGMRTWIDNLVAFRGSNSCAEVVRGRTVFRVRIHKPGPGQGSPGQISPKAEEGSELLGLILDAFGWR